MLPWAIGCEPSEGPLVVAPRQEWCHDLPLSRLDGQSGPCSLERHQLGGLLLRSSRPHTALLPSPPSPPFPLPPVPALSGQSMGTERTQRPQGLRGHVFQDPGSEIACFGLFPWTHPAFFWGCLGGSAGWAQEEGGTVRAC